MKPALFVCIAISPGEVSVLRADSRRRVADLAG
jgi:hypothetical protein